MRTEHELLRRVRPYAPGPDHALARRVREDLMAEIATTPTRSRAGRRRALSFAAPAAAVLVAGVVTFSLLGRGSESAWAADLVRVAEAAPRLLVADDGWRVKRADQFAEDLGEMTFAGAGRELELRWQSADELPHILRDRALSSDLQTTADALGRRVTLFRYQGSNDFTAVWTLDGAVLEARGLAPDVETFKETLAALREVDVDTWLSAMPESVVNPADRSDVVGEMLAGIPLPPGFDSTGLRRGNAVRDRYQLGAQVAGAVACAWIERWVAASEDGDAAAASAAARALGTSRDWQVLHDMDELGAYPEVLWQYVAAVRANAPVPGGKSRLTVGDTYRAALGCPGS